MADKEKKEAGEESEVAAPAKPSSTKKWLLIGGGLLALILTAGAPVLYLSMQEDPREAQIEKLAVDAAEQETLVLEGFEEESEYLEGEERIGALFPFRTFIVNLNGGGFLRVQVQLEFIELFVPKRFHVRRVPVTDGLVDLLSARSKESLSTSTGREQLKLDIKDKVNEILKREEVKRVYFTQFVVQ